MKLSVTLSPVTAMVKYAMPRGSIRAKYSIVDQVRGSVNRRLTRSIQPSPRSV